MPSTEHLNPYKFRKGRSGNPSGRPPGRRGGRAVAKARLPQKMDSLADCHAVQAAVWKALTEGKLDVTTARELTKIVDQRASLMIKQATAEVRGDCDELQGHSFAEPAETVLTAEPQST